MTQPGPPPLDRAAYPVYQHQVSGQGWPDQAPTNPVVLDPAATGQLEPVPPLANPAWPQPGNPPAQPMPHLALRGTCKVYPGHPPVHALDNVTLEITPGEFVAVVGPSGSGKTTMLSIMGTLDTPSAGEVWIDGVDTTQLRQAQRSRLRSDRIGFVFQQFYLLPSLTALDNVATGMLYQGYPPAKRRQAALAALDLVGLLPRASHRPGELSGGEQQRVAIARAIAGGPAILFADEPTGALDQASGQRLIQVLRTVNQTGATVVVITHDEHLATHFSRRISMVDGRVVGDAVQTPRREAPPQPVVAL